MRHEARASDPNTAAPIDWSSVLSQHNRWLRTVILARVGEPQAVDDVFQEVALAAVRQKAPLRDPRKVAPWLYRLCVVQSLLYRRQHGRRRKLVDRYRDRAVEASGPGDGLDWLLSEERRTLVREALRNLQGRDREILLLKYNERWTYRQIAEHLGISESAVEARLHRARARLREQLGPVRETVDVR